MSHKVLTIDELLRLIAAYLVDTDPSSAVALACCCKAFEDPVLDLHWQHQSLDKLASVLPAGILRRSGIDVSPHYVRTTILPHRSTIQPSDT